MVGTGVGMWTSASSLTENQSGTLAGVRSGELRGLVARDDADCRLAHGEAIASCVVANRHGDDREDDERVHQLTVAAKMMKATKITGKRNSMPSMCAPIGSAASI